MQHEMVGEVHYKVDPHSMRDSTGIQQLYRLKYHTKRDQKIEQKPRACLRVEFQNKATYKP